MKYRILLLFLLLLSTAAFGLEEPLRDPKLLADPQNEQLVHVTTARVVMADYDLIRKDFPETRSLSNEEIDRWLLDKTAYVSEPQAAQSVVNSEVLTDGKKVKAYRPKDYGRATVFQAGENGLIDAKGVGSISPRQADHRNGLATLGESIREFTYEKLVKKVMDHSGSGIQTVGTYAVLDLGFDVKHANGASDPAGMILRQAHQRYKGTYSLLDDEAARHVERILRNYGLSSAGAYRDRAVEKVNVQATRDGALIDFGGYIVVDKFEKPAEHFYSGRILFQPGAEGYLQPDPDLRVPFEVWGWIESGHPDPKDDNPWRYAHRLARDFRDGKADRAAVEAHLRTMLGAAEEKLAGRPTPDLHSLGCARLFSKLL